MDRRDALLDLVRGLPADQPVTVPAGWVQEAFAFATPDASAAVDLTAARVADLLGRDPSTVAGWCRTRQFEGAYKLREREWRIPATALAAFLSRGGRAA